MYTSGRFKIINSVIIKSKGNRGGGDKSHNHPDEKLWKSHLVQHILDITSFHLVKCLT